MIIAVVSAISGFGVRMPGGWIADAVFAGAFYATFVLLVGLGLIGPVVLSDLGRRCGDFEIRRLWRWFRVILLFVAVAFLIGLPLNRYLAPMQSSGPPFINSFGDAVVSIVQIITDLTMIFGPLAVLGMSVSMAFLLYPRVVAIASEGRGAPHWTARGAPGVFLRFAGWFGGGQRRKRRRDA